MFTSVLLSQIVLTLLCQALCYEPTEKDLECFNDYETEMKCSFWFDGLISCSGYKLNITQTVVDAFKKYTCIFERSHHSANCECKIKVQKFVVMEIFSTTLLKGTNVLLNKTIETTNFIKPKTPVLSVQKTENGDFNVTWDDKYEKSYFADKLAIHLTYKIKGGHETMSTIVPNSLGFFEIVGRNLQPNTNYILTAAMSTDYNDHEILSDQSAPVEFTSSSSPNELLKTMVPPLCVALIIIICTIFICVLWMKRNWWDKISKPKLDGNLGDEKGPILPHTNMDISSIHVEIPKLDFQKKKKLITASSVDTNMGNEKISSRVAHALERDFKRFNFKDLFSTKNTPSKQHVMSVDITPSRERNCANRDSGNCSGSSVFSNMLYLGSANDDSSLLGHPSCDHSCQTRTKRQFNVPTDALEDGYQSFNGVVNQGNDVDVCLNLSIDVDCEKKFIEKNHIKNPLYPSLLDHDGSVAPSDGGYQAFEGLTKSTEGQWSTSIRTEQALHECGALKFPHSTGQDPTSSEQRLWPSSLHVPPTIEIDTSYQSF